MTKPNSDSSPPADSNDTEKEPLADGEQQPEELQFNQTDSDSTPANDAKPAGNSQPGSDTKLTKATKPAPVVPSSDDRSIGLDDITSIEFKPPLPSKGQMSDFVAKASPDLGLPKSHAWAIWIFATMAHCGHKVYYDDGCVERRIAPNVILAGDDGSGIARRIAVEALALKGDVHVLTDPAALQGNEALEAFSADVRRAVIDTGDENIFLKWHKKVSKQVISLSQLFCKDSLNDYLSGEIRAKSMPPVAVPMLLSCQLKDILSGRKFPFIVFRDSLVVPSFGCRKECPPNAEKMGGLLELLSDSLVAFKDDIFLVLTMHAQEEMEACLRTYALRTPSLKQEGNDAHYRHTNMTYKLLCLAAAYAINDTGADFDGKISKSVMQLAIKAFDQLDEQWNAIDRLYEEAARADEVDTVYEMILAHFSNYYDSELGGLVLPFQELAKAFCHHPVREGQFTTGHLERKVLADLELSGRAKQLVGKSRRDRKWVFYVKAHSAALGTNT